MVFYKRKTAYEMRISGWSSDVCSSDLQGVGRIDGGTTFVSAARLRECIDGEQHLASHGMGQVDAGTDVSFGEIQASEVAGVRGVFQAQVARIGTGIQRGFQGSQATGGDRKRVL